MGASWGEVGGVGGRDKGNAVSSWREPVYGGEEPSGRCRETLEAARSGLESKI